MNPSPLEVALAALRTIDLEAQAPPPLPVQLLVPSHVRITVADHARFRERLKNPHENDADLGEEALS